MGLDASLIVANSGLGHISRSLGVVSQNVANASTPGYARETVTALSVTAGGVGMGVRTGITGRQTAPLLSQALLDQNATVSALTTQQTALSALDALQGTPGSGSDLGSLLGALSDSFSSLATSPESQTQQSAVVSAAGTLASSLNAMADAVNTQRQSAQDTIATSVTQINAALAQIGALTDQIMHLKAAGSSTADLDNQRDAALQGLSQIVGIKALPQENGDLLLATSGGTLLPIHGPANPLSTTDVNLGSQSYYPGGGIPAIMLGGTDITGQLTGGTIGGAITLRDQTLPQIGAQLDEFAETLASRFDAQGLSLFTDPTGAVPASAGVPVQSGYIGFAGTIQVNPTVSTTPSLVRDGTHSVAGSPTGASAFTPNPAGGPEGFTTLITRILDFALGSEAQSGVTQPAPNVSGLGPTGTLAAQYAAPPTLSAFATDIVAAQSTQVSVVQSAVSTASALQTSLTTKLSEAVGVSIDTEMSTMIQLQNAYAANARVIGAVQAMWDQLLQAVR